MDPITSLTAGQAFLVSILGFAIVFFVLVILMLVIGILRSVVNSMEASKSAADAAASPLPAAAAAPAKPAGPPPGMVPAKGSLGEIKLHNVDDNTAALIMAIVADGMQAPLNELRFISIREK
ncbi:MAG: OadG family protein [Planctomycetes bacterium]|nr:OadG family protein [Planctomycetota bacterium]